VGSLVAEHFHRKGHDVTVLTRNPKPAPWTTVAWTGQGGGPWMRELDGADVVINLAGRSVNCRYTDRHRREIKCSRVETTRLIALAIGEATHPPRVWMNASTATIYRHALDRSMDETHGELGGSEPNAPSAWRFSIDVARSWEQAFFEALTPSTRKIALRSAITLGPDPGGVFDILLGLVRAGLGGTAGSGRQFVSWIHYLDFLRSIDFLLTREDLDGPINLASPNPVPNREFMRILREAWGTRMGLPATEWMLEVGAFFLRTETELALKSRRVMPGRLLEAGFDFTYPDWAPAARDLVARVRSRAR
jgi:uncharacterized protein